MSHQIPFNTFFDCMTMTALVFKTGNKDNIIPKYFTKMQLKALKNVLYNYVFPAKDPFRQSIVFQSN